MKRFNPVDWQHVPDGLPHAPHLTPVTGVEAFGVHDKPVIVVGLEFGDNVNRVTGQTLLLTPPAAAELARQLRKVTKQYLKPPADDG